MAIAEQLAGAAGVADALVDALLCHR
jgi:hypothetical protein